MFTLILSSIYFILPAYIANMCPVIFAKLNLPLDKPINTKLFGSHKTYRGVYAAFIGALLMLIAQRSFQLNNVFESYQLLDYNEINILLFAFLFGIGAITGDLIKSFFKRRLGKKPGESWFPFDQLDFVIFAIIFVYPVYQLPWENILVILLITPLLHFLTNITGYLLGFKKVWW